MSKRSEITVKELAIVAKGLGEVFSIRILQQALANGEKSQHCDYLRIREILRTSPQFAQVSAYKWQLVKRSHHK